MPPRLRFPPRMPHGCADLRLAVVSPFVDRQHGTERVLAEVLERLALNYGVEIHLYSQGVSDLAVQDAGVPGARPPGTGCITWHKVPSIRGPHLLQFLWWYFANRFLRWLDVRFRGYSFDLLYSPGINSADADVITVHIVFHAFYRSVRRHLRLGNTSLIRWPIVAHRVLYYRLIMALERRIYPQTNVDLSAVSGLVSHQLGEFFSRSDVRVIPNAVDVSYFDPAARLARRDMARASLGIPAEVLVLLLIGNDWKKKGLDCLLEAVARCRDLSLMVLVVGTDDPGPFLKKAGQLGVEPMLKLLPPSTDVLQFYAVADAYVGPSLEDAFGLPIIESMACGLPVIASVAAGASEIIRDREDGFLLRDPSNAFELESLLRLLYEQPALRARIGAEAARTARLHSWDHHAAQMYELLCDAVSRKYGTRTSSINAQ
jgi:glycosyltransferase involved in cell wall biosynthesis